MQVDIRLTLGSKHLVVNQLKGTSLSKLWFQMCLNLHPYNKGVNKCQIQVMLTRPAGTYSAGEHVSGRLVLVKVVQVDIRLTLG